VSLQTPERLRRPSHIIDEDRVAEFRKRTHEGAGDENTLCFIVHALGREFLVSDEMSQIFLRQVERVIENDDSSLVILRHDDGLELLLITGDNSFSIREAQLTGTRD
jgi:hypothetical protein